MVTLQHAVARPPYYHPPRPRPVAFERPHSTGGGGGLHLTSDKPIQVVYVKHHHHHQAQALNPSEANGNPNPQFNRNQQQQQQQQRRQQQQQSRSSGQEEAESSRMLADVARQSHYYAPREACGRQQRHQQQYQLSDWLSHNSSPRPYVRSAGGEQRRPAPRVVADGGGGGGVGVPASLSATTAATMPTSTVHKSMLRWAPAAQPQQPAYSRLITPASATSFVSGGGGGGGGPPEAPAHSAERLWSASGSGSGSGGSGSGGQENYAPAGQSSQAESREEPASRHSPPSASVPGCWPAKRQWAPGGLGASSSNTLLPDTKRDQCERHKQLERGQIAHQTYRTLPIVLAGPKTRHDLPAGTYMHLNRDPSWELATQLSRRGQRQRQRWLELELPAGPAPPTLGANAKAAASQNAQANISLPQGDARSQQLGPGGPIGGGGGGDGGQALAVHHQQRQREQPLPAFDYRQYIESTRRAH